MEHHKIKWAPKIRQEKILKLYQCEKNGMKDEILIADVGIALWLRCKSILMVYNKEVECPQCGCQFNVQQKMDSENDAIDCPTLNCDWKTKLPEYQSSWRHRELNGTNALPAFQNYFDNFFKAKSFVQKMILVDQLLHSFHWDLKLNLPNRSISNNLIEGSHTQVVDFLNRITYDGSNNKEEWRVNVDIMKKRRQGSKG